VQKKRPQLPLAEIHALLTGQERTQLTTEATTMRPREKGKPAASKTNPPATDPLADALLFLAAHHGRAISREALMAGLPVLDDHLPPPLF
jgi:ATP-binding cassette subfamily C protein LapB